MNDGSKVDLAISGVKADFLFHQTLHHPVFRQTILIQAFVFEQYT
jgi:hypothetical protein